MTYLYLAMAMSCSAITTVCGRLYNNINKDLSGVSRFYNMLVPIFSSLGWFFIWIFDYSFDYRVLPYALSYGVCFSCYTIGLLGALRFGSTSLTALVKQVALVGVSIWGFFFWDTPFTTFGTVGIILIIISLSLCLLSKEEKKENGNLAKWIFFVSLVFAGNAGGNIVQRYQQTAFNNQHKNMLMFFGLLFSSVVCTLLALREKKTNWKSAFTKTWYFPAMTGIACAISNVFILLMIKRNASPVIMYPGIAVGGLMLTTLISLIFFREKLRPAQWLGIGVGAAALVLLNL